MVTFEKASSRQTGTPILEAGGRSIQIFLLKEFGHEVPNSLLAMSLIWLPINQLRYR